MSLSEMPSGAAAPSSSADSSADPTLNALISYALAEVNWAERSMHPTMTVHLRKHHEQHAFMHLTIARRLEELKELLG